MSMQNFGRAPKRLIILGVFGIIFFSILGARLWFLQAVASRDVEVIIGKVRSRTINLLPERGRIFDSAGRVIADNRRTLVVTIDHSVVRKSAQRNELAQRLSGPLNVPVEVLIKRMLDERYGPFEAIPLREGVSEELALYLMERVEDYP